MKTIRKIVVACDSFKGCLSSEEVNAACAEGIRDAMEDVEIDAVPVADGGEGTTPALCHAMGAHTVECDVHDPLMRPLRAAYAMSADGTTAIIDMSAASGLALVPDGRRNPLYTTTFGTGEMILHAVRAGARHIIAGLGGSATTDAGMGMLQALGVKLRDAGGNVMADGAGGAQLAELHEIDAGAMDAAVRATHFSVACDVGNTLYGPDGAAYVFGPQKGADGQCVERLDAGLRQFADAVRRAGLPAVDGVAGGGAAGGMGAAFTAFLDATLVRGIDLVLDAAGFDARVSDASLVITGEGRLDAQTAMGKTPWGVLARARRYGVPVIAVGGSVEDAAALCRAGFAAALSIQPAPLTLAQAMDSRTASCNIKTTVTQIVNLLKMSRL